MHGDYVTGIGINRFAIDGARSGHGDSLRWGWISAEAKDQSGGQPNVLLPTLIIMADREWVAKIRQEKVGIDEAQRDVMGQRYVYSRADSGGNRILGG